MKRILLVLSLLMAQQVMPIFSAGGKMMAAEQDEPYGKADYRDTIKNVVTEVAFFTPDIVNVRKYKAGSNVPRQQLAVTLEKQNVEVTRTEVDATTLSLKAAGVEVHINKQTGQMKFYAPDASLLLSEKANGTTLTPRKDGPFDSYKVSMQFALTSTEQIYGLGQLQNNRFNQRGASYDYMIENNMSVWIPYFYSTKGYSVFWNNASPSTYSESSNTLRMESAVGYGVDYFFMVGSGEQSVANMRQLTGQVPMIPLWAYGYFQSKERYQSADESMGVMTRYRDLAVPIDCVVQDWQYWGDNGHWNALEFLNPNFKNYQEMLDSIHRQDGRMIISTWANFGPQTKAYAYMKANNMLILQGDKIMTTTYPGNAGVAVYDPYNSQARDYYWETYYKNIISKGMDGYWLDSSEPDHYQGGNEMEQTFDFVVGLGCTWRQVRNAFPLAHVEGIYHHHRQQPELSDKRVCILTRSSYAGLQRTGANVWSGDVTASWETLAKQIPAALNYSICGSPNWNSDIGAFFIGDFQGVGNRRYQELYARWLQFATFTAMMRSHGSGIDKAIYRFGEAGTPWFDLLDQWINLRYHLLPYIYSTAWDIHQSGLSLMNAMHMAYPDDTRCRNLPLQFMFGRRMLVAPVVREGAKSRSVYLPEGTWVDFWTGTQVTGGKNVTREVDVSMIPIYMSAGSILPYAYNAQSTRDVQRSDSLQLRIYPGAYGEFVLYEDEGDSYRYEQGAYSTIRMRWDDAAQVLTIGSRNGSFEGMHRQRTFDLVLVNEQRGGGIDLSNVVNKRVAYDGTERRISLKSDDAVPIIISDKEPLPPKDDNSTPYQFTNTDWQTGDQNRVAQSNISYQKAANTITLRCGTGMNNMALSLKRDFWNHYKVQANHTFFCVRATNVSSDLANSAVWYINGTWVGTVNATRVIDLGNNGKMVVWDLTSYLPVYSSFVLDTNGTFSICFGCTSTTGTSVVRDITFMSEDEVKEVQTSVSAPQVNRSQPPSSSVFDLQGRPQDPDILLSNLHKRDVYIVDGRKVMH